MSRCAPMRWTLSLSCISIQTPSLDLPVPLAPTMITEFVSVVWSCRLLSGPSGSQYVYVELFVGFLLMV